MAGNGNCLAIQNLANEGRKFLKNPCRKDRLETENHRRHDHIIAGLTLRGCQFNDRCVSRLDKYYQSTLALYKCPHPPFHFHYLIRTIIISTVAQLSVIA